MLDNPTVGTVENEVVVEAIVSYPQLLCWYLLHFGRYAKAGKASFENQWDYSPLVRTKLSKTMQMMGLKRVHFHLQLHLVDRMKAVDSTESEELPEPHQRWNYENQLEAFVVHRRM